mmetsp:Transcript_4665/g.7926  ORF Transcript_4665/g.7926 Transcript_4665/m.7926 type:complete len:245 (-) Transcript_4665:133-867(-)
MEHIPETLYKVMKNYMKQKQNVPEIFVKLYAYQLLRAIAYIHSMGICHRDIKPQNVLVDFDNNIIKLCDFGSAKQLIKGEPNISYICSRYYRAPELIFGNTEYDCSIDVWSVGCVIAELMLTMPIFPGESGVDQIVEIIKILGTPSKADIRSMNPHYKEFKFPQISPITWDKVFKPNTNPEAIKFVSRLLVYNPKERPNPLEALEDRYFDELRNPNTRMPNGAAVPRSLFIFTQEEKDYCETIG